MSYQGRISRYYWFGIGLAVDQVYAKESLRKRG